MLLSKKIDKLWEAYMDSDDGRVTKRQEIAGLMIDHDLRSFQLADRGVLFLDYEDQLHFLYPSLAAENRKKARQIGVQEVVTA